MDACCETCGPYSFDPTSAPSTSSPTPSTSVCVDDPEWHETDAPFKTCAWMANKIATSWPPVSSMNRCRSFYSSDNVLAMDACCETCGPFSSVPTSAPSTSSPTPSTSVCVDDPEWHETDAPFKTCAWMANKIATSWPPVSSMNRCRSFYSSDNVLAMDACCETCGPLSFAPTSAPSTMVEACVDDPEWHEANAPFKTCAWMATKIATSWPPVSAANRCNSFTGVGGVLAMDACCETCEPFSSADGL